MVKKLATSYRLTPECVRLIRRLANRLGLTQASVVESAIRLLAKTD